MPLSMGSYLLGVGTVIGALTFGFGGGVLLTHTAIEESSAGQTKVKRLARAESETLRTPAARVSPIPNQAAVAPNQDHPASVAAINQAAAPAEQPAAIPPDPVPAQAGTANPDAAHKPIAEAPRQIQAARVAQPLKQTAREPQPPKQVEQTEQTEAKPVESRETDRRAERSRRYGERQQRFVLHEEPAQEVVMGPPQRRRIDLFGGFFGRPTHAND
jgi:hypothetical protein